MATLTSFGTSVYLSNSFQCDVRLPDDEAGTAYASVEHALQAAKSRDAAYRATIRAADGVSAAKSAGRSIRLDRDAWYAAQRANAPMVLRDKFRRSRELRKRLANTEGKIECHEARVGPFWGALADAHGRAGKNVLGEMLTAVRAAVRGADGGAVDWARHFLAGSERCRELARLSVTACRGTKSLGTEQLSGDSVILWGKHHACDVTMEHGSISRQHALFVVAPRVPLLPLDEAACAGAPDDADVGVYVVDLGSTHGTFVRAPRPVLGIGSGSGTAAAAPPAPPASRGDGARDEWERLAPHVPRRFDPATRFEVRFGASSRRYVVETELNYAATAKAKLLSSLANPTEVSVLFMYRYILREYCSQFDSLPLTSLTLTISPPDDRR